MGVFVGLDEGNYIDLHAHAGAAIGHHLWGELGATGSANDGTGVTGRADVADDWTGVVGLALHTAIDNDQTDVWGGVEEGLSFSKRDGQLDGAVLLQETWVQLVPIGVVFDDKNVHRSSKGDLVITLLKHLTLIKSIKIVSPTILAARSNRKYVPLPIQQ